MKNLSLLLLLLGLASLLPSTTYAQIEFEVSQAGMQDVLDQNFLPNFNPALEEVPIPKLKLYRSGGSYALANQRVQSPITLERAAPGDLRVDLNGDKIGLGFQPSLISIYLDKFNFDIPSLNVPVSMGSDTEGSTSIELRKVKVFTQGLVFSSKKGIAFSSLFSLSGESGVLSISKPEAKLLIDPDRIDFDIGQVRINFAVEGLRFKDRFHEATTKRIKKYIKEKKAELAEKALKVINEKVALNIKKIVDQKVNPKLAQLQDFQITPDLKIVVRTARTSNTGTYGVLVPVTSASSGAPSGAGYARTLSPLTADAGASIDEGSFNEMVRSFFQTKHITSDWELQYGRKFHLAEAPKFRFRDGEVAVDFTGSFDLGNDCLDEMVKAQAGITGTFFEVSTKVRPSIKDGNLRLDLLGIDRVQARSTGTTAVQIKYEEQSGDSATLEMDNNSLQDLAKSLYDAGALPHVIKSDGKELTILQVPDLTIRDGKMYIGFYLRASTSAYDAAKNIYDNFYDPAPPGTPKSQRKPKSTFDFTFVAQVTPKVMVNPRTQKQSKKLGIVLNSIESARLTDLDDPNNKTWGATTSIGARKLAKFQRELGQTIFDILMESSPYGDGTILSLQMETPESRKFFNVPFAYYGSTIRLDSVALKGDVISLGLKFERGSVAQQPLFEIPQTVFEERLNKMLPPEAPRIHVKSVEVKAGRMEVQADLN